jgi:hypothetical protein
VIYWKDEVYHMLRWLGQIPHPLKESYRIWTIRLLANSTNKPLRWSVSKAVKDRLDEISEKSLLTSRKRAELYFYEMQQKMDCGLMRDTRPHRAQTALLWTYVVLSFNIVVNQILKSEVYWLLELKW